MPGCREVVGASVATIPITCYRLGRADATRYGPGKCLIYGGLYPVVAIMVQESSWSLPIAGIFSEDRPLRGQQAFGITMQDVMAR